MASRVISRTMHLEGGNKIHEFMVPRGSCALDAVSGDGKDVVIFFEHEENVRKKESVKFQVVDEGQKPHGSSHSYVATVLVNGGARNSDKLKATDFGHIYQIHG